MLRIIFNLREYQARVSDRLSQWRTTDFVGRLRKKDPSLWAVPHQEEARARLGWLTLPSVMKERIQEIRFFADDVRRSGFSHAVLCGMGGSSLAPEVYQATFGNSPGFPELIVADSTHPVAVAAVDRAITIDRTLFIISSKSGTTLETLSLFNYFWKKAGGNRKNSGRQFVAITDRDSPLHRLGQREGFRKIFLAPSDVGGRFSALSEFGLVPAAVIGMDVEKFIDRASFGAESCTEDVSEERASCLYLGAALGEISVGRDKMTLFTSPTLNRFPHWLEQLVAESTGKDGKGIVPVVEEPLVSTEDYGSDRFFVSIFLEGDENDDLNAHLSRIEKSGHPTIRIDLKDRFSLAQEIFRWEVAVASASSIFGVFPFDQPDVELAKDLARRMMEDPRRMLQDSSSDGTWEIEREDTQKEFSSWIALGKEKDYLCLQSYLAPTERISESLQNLRKELLRKTGLASTLGFGPRFLHSTGQLHKGGPDRGLFLQLVDEPDIRIEVPDTGGSFNDLIRAQAFGDYLALKKRKRRILRINLGKQPEEGIRKLAGFVSGN